MPSAPDQNIELTAAGEQDCAPLLLYATTRRCRRLNLAQSDYGDSHLLVHELRASLPMDQLGLEDCCLWARFLMMLRLQIDRDPVHIDALFLE